MVGYIIRDESKFTSTHIRRLRQESNKTDLLQKRVFEEKRQKYKIWMDGFDDVWLGKREILETKLKRAAFRYIHNNPLQPHWGLAEKSSDYLYSSAKFYYSDKPVLVNLTHYLEYF